MKQDLIIEKIHEGTRIDSVLSLLLEGTSRNYISKIIEQGGLKVNGRQELSKKYKVKEGDSIELEIPEPEVLSIEAVVAEVISHILMIRVGMIQKPAVGIYNYLPLAQRSIAKIE